MKQIIPFQKELLFKTKINEITSISLEHTLSLKDENSITGNFQITGDYKMTASSINREKFEFNLPFEIELAEKYNEENIIIDIDNFYYEVINNETLKVNIDVYIEGEKIEEKQLIEEPLEPEIIKEPPEKRVFLEETEEIDIPEEISIPDNNTEESSNNELDFFENIDNSDTYVTYHIYIVKEEDNIDKIMEKFNITKEELSLYNNIEEIKKGTKLIIPSINE